MNNVRQLMALQTMKAVTRSTLRRNAVGIGLRLLWSQGVETQRWLTGAINGRTYRRRTVEHLGTSGRARRRSARRRHRHDAPPGRRNHRRRPPRRRAGRAGWACRGP